MPSRPVFNASATTASWLTAIAPPNSPSAANYWALAPPSCCPSRSIAATSAPTFAFARNVAEGSSTECHSSRCLTPKFCSAWTAHEAHSCESAGTPALLSWQGPLYLCPHPSRRRPTTLVAAPCPLSLLRFAYAFFPSQHRQPYSSHPCTSY